MSVSAQMKKAEDLFHEKKSRNDSGIIYGYGTCSGLRTEGSSGIGYYG